MAYKLVGVQYKETEFEGKKYPKYICHVLDSHSYPNTEGNLTHVYDVPARILPDDFDFSVSKSYDFVIDEGKVVGVFEE